MANAKRVVGEGEDGAGETVEVYSSREAANLEGESQEQDEKRSTTKRRHLARSTPIKNGQRLVYALTCVRVCARVTSRFCGKDIRRIFCSKMLFLFVVKPHRSAVSHARGSSPTPGAAHAQKLDGHAPFCEVLDLGLVRSAGLIV